MEKIIYFDNAAAAVPERKLMEIWAAESMEFFANTEAVHDLAYRGREALKQAAKRVSAALFGRDDYPVVWGGSASELFRILATVPQFETSVMSALEHPALMANLKNFTDPAILPVNSDASVRLPADRERPDLGCFHQVQSELGVIQDTAAIFSAVIPGCRMIDAVQAAGKLPLDKAADVWVISGVKFGAPGGAAMLLCPRGRFTGNILEHAEKYRKHDYAVGRVTVPQVLALVRALESAVENMTENFRHVSEINAFIRENVRQFGIEPTLPPETAASPYILNLMLREQESAVIVRALGEYGIYTASGSACSAESRKPSAALTALGLKAAKAFRALRLSFYPGNTLEEAENFLSSLKKVLKNY